MLSAFPARAGINRPCSIAPSASWRVPRPRGDQPLPITSHGYLAKRSPPARGSTADLITASQLIRAFPARAGINRYAAWSCRRTARVPRPRGDQPTEQQSYPEFAQRSPPARGSTEADHRGGNRHHAFPARAGINRHLHHELPGSDGVPRPRGDQPRSARRSASPRRRSPPARGSTVGRRVGAPGTRAFPARAGINRPCQEQRQGM